jgi:multiple sugar transport system substrate-binding protein/raffinose/stachyose/melibiose transport system substrate-binding protein
MRRLLFLRKRVLFVMLLLLLLLAAACGRGEESVLAEPPQPAELRWVTFDLNSQVEQLLAERYSETHPEITFARTQDQFGNDRLEATPPPDLLTFALDQDYVQAVRNNQLADLSEVWAEAGLAEKLLPNVQALTIDDNSGKQFILPAAFSWAGIYYNKAIFEQYGLQPPQTWDEFLQVCATLKANGEIPLAMTGADSYAYMLWFDYLNLRLNGADYHRDLLAGLESYQDLRIGKVLETWRTLFDRGFVVESPQYLNDLAATNSLIRGDNGMLTGEKAVMVLMDTYSISQMPAKFRAELDFFRFPVIDPSVPAAEAIAVVGYVVPSNADHGVQAQQFLIYLSSPEAQELLATEALFDGATLAPARSDLTDETLSDEMRKATTMIQEAAEVVPFTFIWMPNEMWAGFEIGYRRFLNKEHDAQAFMDSLETARQNAMERGVFVQ